MELRRFVAIGVYVGKDSFIHRLDPRMKIASLGIIVLGIFLVKHWLSFVFLGGFILAVIALSRIPLGFIWRGLQFILFFLLLAFFLNAFLTKGEVIISLGCFRMTREGVYTGGLMTARLIFIVVSTSLLTLTTSHIQLADALEWFLCPFRRVRIPAHEISMMMTIAIRFIPTLMEEAEKIIKAQMARGADFERGHLFRRVRSLLPILVPLFVHAFRVAEDLAVAMEARCYRGGEGRSSMRSLRMSRVDYLAILSLSILFAGVFFLEGLCGT